MSSSLAHWLKAAHWPHFTPKRLLRLIRCFSSITDFMQADVDVWLHHGASPQDIAIFKTQDTRRINACLAWAQHDNHHIMTIDDPAYPHLLKETADPPLVLYVHGNVEALSLPQLALVGARAASPYGLDNASQFARALVARGYAVTSGLARGIDAAAHNGALKGKGVTVAVMGSGMNELYPKSHAKLAAEIVANNGAVITEFSVDAPPVSDHFPRRNRVIAGLSVGVLVVEAAVRSGSLITARLAMEANREVFAIPGPIHHPQARGCHHLIREGATLVETVDDILAHLGALTRAAQVDLPLSSKAPALSGKDRLVFDQIDYVTTTIDAIILRSGLTASEVSSILLSLALQGRVQPVAGGVVRLVVHH
jgi:DNA processing protein